MKPPRFLTGRHPTRGLLWAAVDPNARFAEAAVADRRFGAYLSPFPDETSAHAALLAAGAKWIEVELRRGRDHGGR